MSANRNKDTPGRTMVGFAVVILLVVGTRMQDWWNRENLEWVDYPTAVEDSGFYTGIGDDDFNEPNLRFWGAPDGWVRTSVEPSPKKDEYMQKIPDPRRGRFTQEDSRQYYLYHYKKDELDSRTGLPERVFLKVGQNQFIAFAPASGGTPDSGLRDAGSPTTPSRQP